VDGGRDSFGGEELRWDEPAATDEWEDVDAEVDEVGAAPGTARF
jgi:hypothetical protein